jgi:hypothetical protein
VRVPKLMPVLVAALLLPPGLQAQQADPAPGPADAQALTAEIEMIQARLAPVQEQALADPGIRASREALASTIEAAMARLDPGLAEHLEAYHGLEARLAEAQAAGDDDRVQEIFADADRIQRRYDAAEASAFSQPEIAVRVQGYQARLLARMTELVPEASALLERLAALDRQLHTVISQRP